MVRFFNFLMTLALLGAFVFVGIVWYGKTEFDARGPLQEETVYAVPKGATFASIVSGLEAKKHHPKAGPSPAFRSRCQSRRQSLQSKSR